MKASLILFLRMRLRRVGLDSKIPIFSSSLYKPETPKPKRDMRKERKEYEQKYLSRYKQPKIQKKKASSSLYKPEIPKTKRDMKKERKEYE